MKAWLLDRLGGLDRLRVAEVDPPTPGAGEVSIKVRLAALNPADRYLAEGQYPARPQFPHILGRDGYGTIGSVGAGVESFKHGERVLLLRSDVGVNRPGTFAQYVVAPVASVVEVPDGWSEAEAGGAALVYLTAYQALTQWGSLEPSIVLVTGASGGVGVASLHLARAMGHTVIALSRSAAKQRRLRELGAQITLDPSDTQWRRCLKEALDGRRPELVIDNIGGSLLSEAIDTLGMHGKVSCVGRLAGPTPHFNSASLFFRRIRLGGVAVGTYTEPESQDAWREIVRLLNSIHARPVVDRIFAFDDLLAAFEHLARGPMGKVLLRVDPSAP